MTNEQVFDEVTEICRQVFSEPGMHVTPAMSAKDVEKWDSMTNLLLIDALEKKFGIIFSLDNIMNASNIGDLCAIISQGSRQAI